MFGGQSPEHDISRKSVTSVINNLNKKLYPFKIGDCVYANVSNGHYTKRRKCILECDDRGILLLRPYTDDGKLYKRIFYCEKLEGNYSDYFEKVE